LLKWPGGKSRLAKRLSKMLPAHSSYVEPFAGGAAVFFQKPLAPGKNAIGDYDKWVTDFYRDVKKGGLRKCSGGVKKSKGLFDRAKKSKSACYKIARTGLSFQGGRQGYVGENSTAKAGVVLYKNKLKRFEDYEDKLAQTSIVQGDFAKTMRKFDSPSTLHFLDPPWPYLQYTEGFYKGGKKNRLGGVSKGKLKRYKGTAFDPEHLKRVIKSMKGHVFMIINDHPKLRKIYCGNGSGLSCSTIKVHTNLGSGNAWKKNLIVRKVGRGKAGKVGKQLSLPTVTMRVLKRAM
jgi:site-specific DNA-adenine methylase